jgi:peptide/nickel transport system substrate-binding protein
MKILFRIVGVLVLIAALAGATWLVLPLYFPKERSTHALVVRESLPEILDPFSLDQDVRVFKPNVYEALFDIDQYLRPQKKLVHTFNRESDLVWNMRLRQGVRFHDWSELTADDVKATFEKAVTINTDLLSYTNTIENVEVVDMYGLRITTKRPDAELLMKLAYIPIVKSVDGKWVGTGPYTLTSSSADAMEFAAFPEYFSAKPWFTRVTVLRR